MHKIKNKRLNKTIYQKVTLNNYLFNGEHNCNELME